MEKKAVTGVETLGFSGHIVVIPNQERTAVTTERAPASTPKAPQEQKPGR